MKSEKFEKELLDAITVALDGSGIKPLWVLKHITPIIGNNISRPTPVAADLACTCAEKETYVGAFGLLLCRHCNKPAKPVS